MLDRFGEALSLFLGVLAIGYLVYEIDRRQRKLHDIWDVLDGEDGVLTPAPEAMVGRGGLQPFAGGARAGGGGEGRAPAGTSQPGDAHSHRRSRIRPRR